MNRESRTGGLPGSLIEKIKSSLRFNFRKGENEKESDSRLAVAYGRILFEKVQAHGQSVENACTLQPTNKQDLKKAVEVILDMKSLNSLATEIPDIKKPLFLPWYVDSKWVVLKMTVFYMLLTSVIAKLLGLHSSINVVFLFIGLYLVGLHYRGKRYFKKITVLLGESREWRKDGYRINVNNSYWFVVKNMSVKDVVDTYFDKICEHRNHSYIEEALMKYKEEKPNHYNLLEDKLNIKTKTDTERKPAIQHSKSMEEILAKKITDFIYKYFKPEGTTISGPSLLEEDENGRQEWWMNIKGVTAEQLERKIQSLENYTGRYVSGKIHSGKYHPGDIVFYLASSRKDAFDNQEMKEEVVEGDRATIERNGIINNKNPVDKQWKELFNQTFPKHEYKTPDFICNKDSSTEYHIMKIRGITAQDYQSKIATIESQVRKQVYFIHENFEGNTGITAIELANKKLASMITYNEIEHLISRDRICLGFDVKGPVEWDPNLEGHCGIAARTGSGKSAEVRFILWQLLPRRDMIPRKDMIIIFDFKGGIEFSFLREKGYIVLGDTSQFNPLSQQLCGELEARISYFKELGITQYSEYEMLLTLDKHLRFYPRIFVIIEEANALKLRLDSKDFAVALRNLTELVLRAKSFGIHIILTAQRPTAESFINADIRSNLGVIVGGWMSSSQSIMIFEDKRATNISDIKGRFKAKGASSESEYQIPFMTGQDFQILEWARNPYENYVLGSEGHISEQNYQITTETKSTQNPFW
ncbi:DUF87 domain-containing protein [Cohnella sp. CFH 77786]|uniref:helicase HerA domain-containing protein n=1 Tax=Cohnella sp. CFH 77786 TaxID=2662265 RepID=UPI001C60C923|nr:DUF87 domain-containing protein [Cohnella sp. CFH 77786]MBW5448635.1 DUF87 domain-containing protein [Cohnella sp. CFH 77786]